MAKNPREIFKVNQEALAGCVRTGPFLFRPVGIDLPPVGCIGIDLAREGSERTVETEFERGPDGRRVLKSVTVKGLPVSSGMNHAFEEAVAQEVDRRMQTVAARLRELRSCTHGVAAEDVCLLAAQIMQALEGQEVATMKTCTRCPNRVDRPNYDLCYDCAMKRLEAAPSPAQVAQEIIDASPRRSVCCNAETFQADGRLVCNRCRCTRPL